MGSCILGVVSGVLGTFSVLRRQSLLGDVLSHAALPGIGIAFLLTGSKASLILMLGAAFTGVIGALSVVYIVQHTILSEDSVLGTVLSVFFGWGVVLLTIIAKRNDAQQAGLEKYLFGQAATILMQDVISMAVIGSIALVLTFLFYKELKLLTFDSVFAQTQGFSLTILNVITTVLTVVAVVIGLKAVGVVLMAAMLIGPSVAARQWTNNLSSLLALSAVIGALSGFIGSYISVIERGLPTGPIVILTLSVFVLLSILFGTERGLVWQWLRIRKHVANGAT